jgi:hypothetical protein
MTRYLVRAAAHRGRLRAFGAPDPEPLRAEVRKQLLRRRGIATAGDRVPTEAAAVLQEYSLLRLQDHRSVPHPGYLGVLRAPQGEEILAANAHGTLGGSAEWAGGSRGRGPSFQPLLVKMPLRGVLGRRRAQPRASGVSPTSLARRRLGV